MVSEPHGGELVDRETSPPVDVQKLPEVEINNDQYMDLEMIATGAYSPLTGFMDREDFRNVLYERRLSDGTPWSIPVVLTSDERPEEGKHALRYGDSLVGAVEITDVWQHDWREWSDAVLDTTDTEHPGVRRIRELDTWMVGGEIELYSDTPEKSYEIRRTPRDTRREFRHRGWDSVVGFQTRNPPHRAHEYLQKCALETVDGLFLQPIVGSTKPTDVDADVRMEAYERLVEGYHVVDRVSLSTLKTPMRYAGPREALFHAIVRQNYGCTHFIIGRDHAGVKDYYGSYEAHELLRSFEDEIDVTPLYFDYAFYCHGCDGMATKKTCSHGDSLRENPSGTKIRRKARRGGEVSDKIMRPEIWRLVRKGLDGEARREQGAELRTEVD
ncbi:MAG: sulfate adenylyltransferase [Halobacteria archaeon]